MDLVRSVLLSFPCGYLSFLLALSVSVATGMSKVALERKRPSVRPSVRPSSTLVHLRGDLPPNFHFSCASDPRLLLVVLLLLSSH